MIKVAVLIDLPRGKNAGGHVKYWERIAQATAREKTPVDLTIYFSGQAPDDVLAPHVRYRYLPPVFSTEKLKFLPYVPAHTDLAPFHKSLAKELTGYDIIHTTDAFFAFARTAENVSRKHKIPLVTSFHTDTPAYAELFARQTLMKLSGKRFGSWFDKQFRISRKQRTTKNKRLRQHLAKCSAALAMRPEDKKLAQEILSADHVSKMRLGVDKEIFKPQQNARAEIEKIYNISAQKFLVLFVGRIDPGKNVPLLVDACDALLAQNVPLHLMMVGQGPLEYDIKQRLGPDTTLTGVLPAEKLAQIYAAVDCLAIASDIEIGGMIGLEALAAGCPVLVSEKSGVAQLCGNTEAMQQVESNHAAWVTALGNFSQSPDTQARMREAALAYRQHELAGWGEVLSQDFLPVWQSLAKKDRTHVR